MRPHRAVLTVGLSALALACDKHPTAPALLRPPNAVDVVMEFCFLPPAWMAIKNEGYDWAPVPDVGTTTRYALAVTPKVAVAYGYASQFLAGWSEVHVFYLTAPELAEHRCGPPRGSNLVYAPVAGVAATDYVSGYMGPGSGLLMPGQVQMTFVSVPSGIQDLVAYSRPPTSGTGLKFIVRHNVGVSNRALIPTLDFASAEAVAPLPVTVTAPGAFGLASSVFITNRGAVVPLTTYGFITDSVPVNLLPASVVSPGDGFVVSVGAATRYVTRYFTAPAPQSLTLGSALTVPTITTLATTPSLMFRAELPSQAEYPSLATATFSQNFASTNEHRVSVTMSAAYLGATPATWTLDVPDLTRVITKDMLLVNGTTTTWTAEAWNVRAPLYFSKFGATDGETVRCATSSLGLALTICRSPLTP